MIKLIATDLDGTLLGDDKVIPPEIFTLAEELEKRGILFVPASGRSPYTLKSNFAPIADRLDYICDNGAVALSGGKEILSHPLDREILGETLEFCKSEGFPALFCGSDATYLEPVEGTVYENHINPYYFIRKTYKSIDDILGKINKIAICDMSGPGNGSYERLKRLLGGRAGCTISGSIWMDVMQNGVNKGEALAAIQSARGITKEETVAFGDYYNDIPLLERAGYAYVMKNAEKGMFEYGNRIADGNNDGGVIKVIKSILNGTFK